MKDVLKNYTIPLKWDLEDPRVRVLLALTRVEVLLMEVIGFLLDVGGILGRSVSNVGGGRNGGSTAFRVESWMEEWGVVKPCKKDVKGVRKH